MRCLSRTQTSRLSSPISSPSGSTGTAAQHGGEIDRLDDDHLARLTEEERVAAGVDAFDPDEVPAATDSPPLPEDIRDTEVYQDERAEVVRETEKGELYRVDEEHPFPPTRYDD